MHLPLDPPGPCGLLGVDCEDFPAPPGALGPELPFLTVEVLVLSGDTEVESANGGGVSLIQVPLPSRER